MEGRKFKFILEQSGISCREFALLVGKNERTVSYWRYKKLVGERYVLVFEELLGNRVYTEICEEYEKQKSTEPDIASTKNIFSR